MTHEEFEQYTHEGFLLIPEKFREKIQNVALLIEDEPSYEVRAREGLSEYETLLGYYQGIPHTARGAEYGVGMTMPDTITLYRMPILEAAGEDPEKIKKVIADTIWHEFAHYFGMDEETVQTKERKKGVRH